MAASVAPFENGSNPAVLTQVTRRMQDGVPHFPERPPGMSLVDEAEGQGSPPLVWRHYHQATRDAAYDQSHYAPNQADTKARRILMSKIALDCLGSPDVFAYGEGAVERFDLYRSRGSDRPLVVYVHGGA